MGEVYESMPVYPDPKLKAILKKLAKEDERSLSNYVIKILKDFIKEKEKKN